MTTTTTEASTTTSGPAVDDLVLEADGLGVVDFGDDAESALASLTDVLGQPTLDTGWGDPQDEANQYLWPGCPGTTARIVSWADVLGVVFTNWDPSADEPTVVLDAPYLAGAGLWRGSPVQAAGGGRPGDSLARLREIYGDRLYVSPQPDAAIELHWFAIDGEWSPWGLGGVRGWLYPPPDYPGGPVSEAGPFDDTYIAGPLTSGLSCDTP